MLKILKYSFYDLSRSLWSYVYFFFYLVLGVVLLYLNNDLSNAVITLMNVIIILVPLIGTIFGVMYFYNSREFTELLLAQPVRRSSIFLGQYLGVAISYRPVLSWDWVYPLLFTAYSSRGQFGISLLFWFPEYFSLLFLPL